MAALGARRVDAQTAKGKAARLTSALDAILSNHGIEGKSHFIRSFRNKQSYGDIDLLVPDEAVAEIGEQVMVAELGALLGVDLPYLRDHPKAPLFHTALPLADGSCVQVDLIRVPSVSFEWATDFFAWNDLSKLMHLLVRTMSGLNFGVNGLSRSVKHRGQVIGHVTFTRDFQEALSFLGFDAQRFSQGFDDLVDVYEFMGLHPALHSSIYQWENRNSKGRGQDIDRPTYLGFLEWLKTQPIPYDTPEDDTDWVEKAYARFPEAEQQRSALFQEVERAALFRKRFCGSVIAKVTGLSGPDLGDFTKAFRWAMGEEDFQSWVLGQTDTELHSRISHFHQVSYSLDNETSKQSGESDEPGSGRY